MDISEQQQVSETRNAPSTARTPFISPPVMARWVNGSAILLPAAAVVTVFFYCRSLPTNTMQTFAPSAMAAGAALISGSFLGFLFAVPRAQPETSDGST